MFYKTPFLDSLNDDKKILKDKLSNILNHITHLLETDNIETTMITSRFLFNKLTSFDILSAFFNRSSRL